MVEERIKLGLLRMALERPTAFKETVQILESAEQYRIEHLAEAFQKRLQASKDGKKRGRLHYEIQIVYNFVAEGLDPNLG